MILVENQDEIYLIKTIGDKERKGTKKSVIKRKLKFENHKDCLEATKLDNNINIKKKNEITINGIKKDCKGFLKGNKLILKSRQFLKVKSIKLLLKKLIRLL